MARPSWLDVQKLPGYAPDLNPVETLWGNVDEKEHANRCAVNLDEVSAAVRGGMARVRRSRTLPFSSLKRAGLSLLQSRHSIMRDSVTGELQGGTRRDGRQSLLPVFRPLPVESDLPALL